MDKFVFNPNRVAYTKDGELQKFNFRNPNYTKDEIDKESDKQSQVNKDIVSDFISGSIGDFLSDSLPSIVIGLIALILVTLGLNAIVKNSSGKS